jgi:predicted extracellular nuclease|tara:strand:- start:419 stop:1396 length:978 start_codon:yes stop_codon:yes gene_type:complete
MEYYIAWWNVENLFDIDSANTRSAWLQKTLVKELNGWTSSVLKNKVGQLASVIQQMNDGHGPDILGVCEVESGAVLTRLVNALSLPDRIYGIVHSDTKDARGVDVAFIFDKKKFKTPKKIEVFNYVVLKRNATRDIVQVNFKTKSNPEQDLVLIGNHWPSRMGGELSSEPYRIIAAETLSYWLERISDKLGKEVPVVVMGDFNDEPYNRSMQEYALSEKDSKRVKSKRSTKPYLYNLMWPLQTDGAGTHYYDTWGMLDQILVNRPLLTRADGLSLVKNSQEVIRFPKLIKSGKPRRFDRPSAKGFDPSGYSDHLSISVKIQAADS